MPKKTPSPAPTTPPQAGSKEPGLTAEGQIGFFEQLQRFTPKDWHGLKVYVYRLWPVIDRKDTEHFLAKISQPCDEDYLLSTFGTGKYYLRLNDSKGRTIASTTVSLYHPDYPPRVNPEEVVASDPRNDRYFKAWGKAGDAAGGSSDVGAVADIARVALEKAAQASTRPALDPQIVELWEKTTRERDEPAQKLVEPSRHQPACSGTDRRMDAPLRPSVSLPVARRAPGASLPLGTGACPTSRQQMVARKSAHRR